MIYFPLALITAGFLIMVFNIVQFSSLFHEMRSVQYQSYKKTQFILYLYFSLMIFFLAGYFLVGLSLLNPKAFINNTLVGMILFFGGIFVMIGTIIQLRLCRTVEKTGLEITQTLINTVEARDTNLNGHSLHVARLTLLIYGYLPRKQQSSVIKNDLQYAALLHDIGKLGISDEILNKSTGLTDYEWSEIRKHPIIGKKILSSLKNFYDISEWILYHHERMDGNGYYHIPREQIPLESRIIAVADTYSAITMTRSYRDSRSHEQACTILEECSGTQFDTAIVQIFLSIPKSDVEECKPAEIKVTADIPFNVQTNLLS